MRQGRNFDHATLAKAFSHRGIDPGIWISYARVDESTPETGDVVVADEEDGQVYVDVTLKPSDFPARARVGMIAAGAGEAVYFPLVGGDEVLVAIPEADVRAGAVIIARLNNRYDPFPRGSVAGKDGASNAFGMIRTRSAMTIESGQSLMLRSAAAGAFLLLDAKGNITLRDGAKGVLQMGADVFGYQDANTDVIFQFDLNALRLNMQVGDASMILGGNASGTNPQSYLGVPSTLAVATAGLSINNAVEHVLTTEALYANLFALATAMVAVPLPLPTVTIQAVGAALLSILAVAPTTPGLPAALLTAENTALSPLLSIGIQAALATATIKPPGVPALGQAKPGIGSAGFLTG
jgi:hypothetical protein